MYVLPLLYHHPSGHLHTYIYIYIYYLFCIISLKYIYIHTYIYIHAYITSFVSSPFSTSRTNRQSTLICTISKAPTITPHRREQYWRSLYCGGNSTNSTKGFSLNTKLQTVFSAFQFKMSQFKPKNILNATLAMTSAVSLKLEQFETPLFDRNSSIILHPILCPIFSSC
jgi:hypothetical protein